MVFAQTAEWVPVATALIALLGTVFSGVMGYFVLKLNLEVAATKVVAEQAVHETIKGNLVVVKVEERQTVTNERIDGMQTALIDAIGGQKKAEGKLEGIASEQSRIAGDIEEIKTNGGHAEPSDTGSKVIAVVKAEKKE